MVVGIFQLEQVRSRAERGCELPGLPDFPTLVLVEHQILPQSPDVSGRPNSDRPTRVERGATWADKSSQSRTL